MLYMEEDTNDLLKYFIKLIKFLIYLILLKNLFRKKLINLGKKLFKEIFSMYSI